MSNDNNVPQVPVEVQLHRANIVIDRLREHLTAVTENLIAEEAEVVMLNETIQSQVRVITQLAAQLNPPEATAHLGAENDEVNHQEVLDV